MRLADTPPLVDLDAAIALLETGRASEALRVDLGEGCIARVEGHTGLAGLLQRLRGHRLILAIAASPGTADIRPMRAGKPDMHPDVASILDALKNQP